MMPLLPYVSRVENIEEALGLFPEKEYSFATTPCSDDSEPTLVLNAACEIAASTLLSNPTDTELLECF
jgi:hypothetical protein